MQYSATLGRELLREKHGIPKPAISKWPRILANSYRLRWKTVWVKQRGSKESGLLWLLLAQRPRGESLARRGRSLYFSLLSRLPTKVGVNFPPYLGMPLCTTCLAVGHSYPKLVGTRQGCTRTVATSIVTSGSLLRETPTQVGPDQPGVIATEDSDPVDVVGGKRRRCV